jgi:hypothetical protein
MLKISSQQVMAYPPSADIAYGLQMSKIAANTLDK